MLEVLTADGRALVADMPSQECCPPPLCGTDLCGAICAFINILPSGPMWDYWKQQATSYFQISADPTQCPAVVDPQCPTLIQHAIYVVFKLRDVVWNALWPALRESDPYTAELTLDDWLTRYRWEDCYKQHCRSVLLGDITPYEIVGECGPIFCPPTFPPELECAIKRATVIALTRAQMSPIKNLDGLNWIIEPLGAGIRPKNLESTVCPDPDEIKNNCDSYSCSPIAFEIYHKSDYIDGCLGDQATVCNQQAQFPRPLVIAFIDNGCDIPAGLPTIIWPGLLVAECIIRSLLPATCGTDTTITQTCEMPDLLSSFLLLSGDQATPKTHYHLWSGDQAPGRQYVLGG